MKKEKIIKILSDFQSRKLIVIGDIMLDEYIWGNVDRISPEAPVPIVDVIKQSFHLGGAGNVAHNLKFMDAKVSLIGVIGDDHQGVEIIDKLDKNGIDSSGIFKDKNRKTTQKTRIIAHSQHVVRVDREKRSPIDNNISEAIIKFLKTKLTETDAVIFEDYDKGVLSPPIIEKILKLTEEINIPVFVDPKFKHFFSYRNVTVFKPNCRELSFATGISGTSENELTKAAKKVQDEIGCTYLLLTRGESGMLLYRKGDNEPFIIPTKANEVYDVSGAGDTVISALALSYSSGSSIEEAAIIASHAAAVQVRKIGAQTVSVDEIKENLFEDFGY